MINFTKRPTQKMDVKLQADLSTEFNIDVIIQDKKETNLNITVV